MKNMMKVLTLGVALSAATTVLGEDAKGSTETAEPRVEEGYFNGEDLTGWKAPNMEYWSVKDGVITGTAGDKAIPKNQFLWNDTVVKDFYLSLKVRQVPYSTNAGIQFRSTPKDGGAGAFGYQADVGQKWWGTLYHEHGRRILGRNVDTEEANINREGWNHYQILAVGHRVWLVINDKITVALRDPDGELAGEVALQIHSGAAQTVEYKELKLIHNPKVELIGKNEAELDALLADAPTAEEIAKQAAAAKAAKKAKAARVKAAKAKAAKVKKGAKGNKDKKDKK